MDKSAIKILNNVAKTEKHLQKASTVCLCPTCAENAIRSHSQQKRGGLSYIAENGHVMGVRRQVAGPLYRSSPESPPVSEIGPIGIQDASTFWGYCNEHDTKLFEEIECQPLQAGNANQVFALHLRALSYEIKAKYDQLEIYKQIPAFSSEVKVREHLLDADSEWHWNLLWRDDKLTKFRSDFLWEWRVIQKNIGVSMAAMLPPLPAVFEDRYMTAHMNGVGEYDVPRPAFSLSVVPANNETHLVMCWHKNDSDFVARWRNEFLTQDDKQLACFLNKCIFTMSEDYFLRPSLWDSLSKSIQEVVRKRLLPCSETYGIPNVIVL